jgi:hypothetical protein
MNGRRGGFINIKDMYNNDVGKGGVYAYEAHEVNKGWRSLECLFTSEISYRHRYWTHTYYAYTRITKIIVIKRLFQIVLF